MHQLSYNKSYRIQVLRGLAIIAVVFIHNTPNGIAQIWCRPFLNYCVGLFLFLSGMLSCAERWDPKKRILKIAIPYMIWTLVYVIIGKYKNPTQIPISYVKNLITAKSAAVMYYVFVYCELTLLIPLIDKLARSKYRWIGFLITPCEIIVMRLIPLMAGFEANEYIRVIMEISCLGWFTYYYLGYLLGNGLIKIKAPSSRILLMWICSIALQILEGYWYISMGDSNCGTQVKLTAVLSGVLISLLAYQYLNSENTPTLKLLHNLGDISFGVFFSHLAVQSALGQVSHYRKYIIYPFNAIVVIAITAICVVVGRKVFGKNSKYLAL